MDQKRLILAAFLSLLVLLGWAVLFPPPEAPVRQERAPAEPSPAPSAAKERSPAAREGSEHSVPAAESARKPSPAAPEEPIAAAAEQEVVIDSPAIQARFTNRGAQILSFRLLDVQGRGGGPLEMVRRRSQPPYPFALVDREGRPSPLNEALFDVESVGSRGAEGETIRFRYRGEKGAAVKEFHFRPNGLFDVSIEVEGGGDWGVLLGPGLRNPLPGELENRFQLRAASWLRGGEMEDLAAAKLEEPRLLPGTGTQWFALEDTYFLTLFAPTSPVAGAVVQPMLVRAGDNDGPPTFLERPPEGELSSEQEELSQEIRMILVPEGGRLEGTGYWGAKEYRRLASLPFGMERTIRWGTFGLLARPMLFALLWIHERIIDNYGWSIVLLTFLIKLALMPLTHRSYVSMQKMQKLSPKIEAIKQKYRGKQRDKQGKPNLESQRKMNEEMQALFRSEGVNPAGGCLPLLLQMPVFFAFYSLLRNSVELWNAPWALWIQDLSAPDPFYALPIIMGGTQFLQQRLTPVANANPGQRVLLNTMPIWFTVISFGFASGLVLYWLTNNVLTIMQQSIYQQLKKAGYLGGQEATSSSKKAATRKEERVSRGKRR